MRNRTKAKCKSEKSSKSVAHVLSVWISPTPNGSAGKHSAPCVNRLESKEKTISGECVDGLILKHWATSRVHAVRSKREWLRRRTTVAGSKFSGR
jgi:hypothetical protein